MRFRTQIRQVRQLVQSLTILGRVTKGDAVWKLCERRLMLVGGGGSGQVQVVCTINTSQVMEAMRIESKQNNQIYLRVDVASLLRILKPADRASDVNLKLGVCKETRKPILIFDMHVKATSHSNSHDIVQEIPVSVMNDEEVGDMVIPDVTELGSGSVSLFLPPLQDVRPFVEKMAKIAEKVQATATVFRGESGLLLPNGGVLELRTQTPMFSSATQYQSLPTFKGTEGEAGGEWTATVVEGSGGAATQQHRTATCVVDAKRLLSVLDVDKIAPSQVLAHFSPQQLVVHATANGEIAILFQVPGLT